MNSAILIFCFLSAAFSWEDRPHQIVHPDDTHTKLVVNDEAIQLLNSIEGNVAVVAVVGPYHSGKSFLLNQLMSKTKGFKLGPTMLPSTMGLWIWGSPLKTTIDGKEVSVVFLDTEGFYANNVSEAYDAKIFAVSTLLSSYLVYNSIKIIDQAAIDYLELLARRTQLFSLKSEINSTSEFQSTDDIISFPPLMWVVKDFISDLEDKSCSYWLNNMLSGFRRDSVDGRNEVSALPTIFPAIECSTLFIPAVDKDGLRHLDDLSETQFTSDYKNDIKDLKSKVFSGIKLKKKLSKTMDGPGLATLLRLLVQFANEGAFPQIPSLWSGFLALQKQNSVSDALNKYKQHMAEFRTSQSTYSDSRFETLHSESTQKATAFLRTLLFGVQDVYEEAAALLKKEIEEVYKYYKEENNKRIEVTAKSVFDSIIQTFETQLAAFVLPISSFDLEKAAKQLMESGKTNFTSELKDFKESAPYSSLLQNLEKSMQGSYSTLALSNMDSINKKFAEAVEKVSQVYSENIPFRDAATTSELEQFNQERSKTAFAKFDELVGFANKEQSYSVYKNQAENDIQKLYDTLLSENKDRLRALIEHRVENFVTRYQELTKPVLALLPLEENELLQTVEPHKRKVFGDYREQFGNFSDTPEYKKFLDDLEEKIKDQDNFLKKTNIELLKVTCQDALNKAKSIISPNAGQYYFTWAFNSYAFAVADEQIGDAIKSKNTKAEVIRHFIESDLRHETALVSSTTRKIGIVIMALFGGLMFAVYRFKIAPFASNVRK